MDNPAHRQLVNDLTREGESFHDSSPKIVDPSPKTRGLSPCPANMLHRNWIYIYIRFIICFLFYVQIPIIFPVSTLGFDNALQL
jgi:hypothetical protein